LKASLILIRDDKSLPLACYNICGYSEPMVLELKLRKIGNSVGIVLPKEALSHLKAGEGDTVTLSEQQSGFSMTAQNPEFAKTMAVFEDLSRRYRNTLAELAK
jgi:putative addiction module antidote